jgi:hypothetical protein
MYKKKFHDWGWRKNINRELALVAAKKRARREEDGRPASVIRIHGKPVPDSKIDRHVKRLKAGLNEGKSPASVFFKFLSTGQGIATKHTNHRPATDVAPREQPGSLDSRRQHTSQ